MKKTFWYRPLVVMGLLLAVLAFAGCSGDDGDDGKNGKSAYQIAVDNGFEGTEQEWLDSLAAIDVSALNPIESCVVCHGEGAVVGVDDVHASSSTGSLAVSNIVVTNPAETNDLVVTFNVRVNGANKSNYDQLGDLYLLNDTQNRAAIAGAVLSSSTSGNGSNAVTTYKVTITDGVTQAGEAARFLFYARNAAEAALPSAERPAGYRAYVTFDYPASPIENVLGDTACNDCHSSFGNGFHRGAPSYGGKTCTVCHDALNTTYPTTAYMIHGIHSSAGMPTGSFDLETRAEVPRVWEYAITFPSYMNNCSICHSTEDGLADINEMPVQGLVFEGAGNGIRTGCFTCHQSMAGFEFEAGLSFHESYTNTTNCEQCHNDGENGIARYEVTQFHNGAMTERAGLIWDGADQSVVEGARINHYISGVTRTGDTLAITWGAQVDGKDVDPCNTTPGTSAPTFDSGYSVLKAFFQGGDLVNANNGNGSPGQANSTNLSFGEGGNTVCVGNVATTTITLTAAEAALTGNGRVGLQGKPNILFAPEDAPEPTSIQTRAMSPIYDYALADGAAVAARRTVTDSSLCLNCHVGSLYQHGGNRVDNVELCVMCHNEASSEQNVREGMGVDASEAYDGLAGQTYGFKSMLHAVHATGETGAPIVIYRNRGIYAFAGSPDLLPNWPGTGEHIVYGSDPPNLQNHNFVTAHYPRNLNDCSACHPSGFSPVPDQSVAVATTLNAGMEPWDNQLDDVLQGPAAAACTSCHKSTDSFTDKAIKAHAYQNGWYPTFFEEGRQTILDSAE